MARRKKSAPRKQIKLIKFLEHKLLISIVIITISVGLLATSKFLINRYFVSFEYKVVSYEEDILGNNTVTKNWQFDTPANYSLSDPDLIQVASGNASLIEIDQLDNDDTSSGFGGGVHSDTEWDGISEWVELSASGLVAGSGTFSSRIIDAGGDVSWDSIAWTPEQPYYKELPDSGVSETAYTSNNANMSSNVLLYHLNESSGTIVDSSGAGNNGTSFGSVIYGSSGRLNSAMDFDGSSGYIAIQNKFYTGAGSLDNVTTCAWINKSADTGRHPIVDYDRSDFWSFAINFSGSQGAGILTWDTTSTPGGTHDMGSTIRIDDSTWHHVCATFDSSAVLDKRIYIDGVLNASADGHPTGAGLGISSTRYGFIGDGSEAASFNSSRNNLYFDGLIDEVAIWDRTLTTSEITDLYQRGAYRIEVQVRSCDDPVCDTEPFIGPDGTAGTFYSELNNSTSGLPEFSLTNVPDNQYFQYKLKLSTDDNSFGPLLSDITIGPTHYPVSNPYIKNIIPVAYGALISLDHTLGAGNLGSIEYQISKDSINWYYWDGSNWTLTINDKSPIVDIDNNINTFTSEVGEGDFYFKATLVSDGTKQVELDTLSLDYDSPAVITPTNTPTSSSKSSSPTQETVTEPTNTLEVTQEVDELPETGNYNPLSLFTAVIDTANRNIIKLAGLAKPNSFVIIKLNNSDITYDSIYTENGFWELELLLDSIKGDLNLGENTLLLELYDDDKNLLDDQQVIINYSRLSFTGYEALINIIDYLVFIGIVVELYLIYTLYVQKKKEQKLSNKTA